MKNKHRSIQNKSLLKYLPTLFSILFLIVSNSVKAESPRNSELLPLYVEFPSCCAT
jgi:hypothetical protein